VGYGTTFKIMFPAGKSHFSEKELTSGISGSILNRQPIPHPQPSFSDIEDPSPQTLTSATLLIIEDNTELRNYLKRELKDLYKIVTATDGIEGLKISKELMPDIIMTDILMPGMNGYEF